MMPVYPNKHTQLNLANSLRQTAPFRHGLLPHSFTSVSSKGFQEHCHMIRVYSIYGTSTVLCTIKLVLTVDSLLDSTFNIRKKLPKLLYTHPKLMYQITPPPPKKKNRIIIIIIIITIIIIIVLIILTRYQCIFTPYKIKRMLYLEV